MQYKTHFFLLRGTGIDLLCAIKLLWFTMRYQKEKNSLVELEWKLLFFSSLWQTYRQKKLFLQPTSKNVAKWPNIRDFSFDRILVWLKKFSVLSCLWSEFPEYSLLKWGNVFLARNLRIHFKQLNKIFWFSYLSRK